MGSLTNYDRAMQGGRGISDDRVEKDFYPTPAWATRLLLHHHRFRGRIWEPACGDGQMAEVIKERYMVHASDVLVRGGYERAHTADFLTAKAPKGVQSVITNPPFYLGRQFVARCVDFKQAALLLKVTIFAGHHSWVDTFRQYPPQRVLFIRERLEFWKDDRWNPGVFAHAWLVWDRSGNPNSRVTLGKTTAEWVSKEDLK